MTKESIRNKTVDGFIWLSVGKIVQAISQLGVLFFLARIIEPRDFGILGMAMLIISFSDIFTDLGVGPALIQKKDLTDSDTNTGFYFSVILGFLSCLLVWALSPFISNFFNELSLIEVLKAISIVLLIKSFGISAKSALYRDVRYKEIAISEVASYIIGYGITAISLAYLGFEVWSLVFAVIFQALFSTLLFNFFAKIKVNNTFSLHSLKSLLFFGGGYSLSKVFSYLGSRGDNIVVGKLLGPISLGFYERAFQLTKFFASLVGELMDKTLFSPLARKQNDKIKLRLVFLDLSEMIALVLLPISFFLSYNAYHIIVVLLGDKWIEAVSPTRVLSLAIFLMISSRVGNIMSKSIGKVYSRALINMIYGLVVLIGAYFGSNWGILGVSFAVMFALFLNYIFSFIQIRSLLDIKIFEFIKIHFHGFALAFLTLVSGYLMQNLFVIQSSFLVLLSHFLLCIFIFFIYIKIFPNGVFSNYAKVLIDSLVGVRK